MKTYGYSDESQVPPEEILAAEIAQNASVWDAFCEVDRSIEDDLRRLGVRGYLDLGIASPDAQHADMSPPGFQDDFDRRDYWAGWLANEIARGDGDGWPWDPSRPVAGQYEEYELTQRPTHELDIWPDADLDDAIRAIRPLTDAELAQPECPAETAEAIERIADAVEDDE